MYHLREAHHRHRAERDGEAPPPTKAQRSGQNAGRQRRRRAGRRRRWRPVVRRGRAQVCQVPPPPASDMTHAETLRDMDAPRRRWAWRRRAWRQRARRRRRRRWRPGRRWPPDVDWGRRRRQRRCGWNRKLRFNNVAGAHKQQQQQQQLAHVPHGAAAQQRPARKQTVLCDRRCVRACVCNVRLCDGAANPRRAPRTAAAGGSDGATGAARKLRTCEDGRGAAGSRTMPRAQSVDNRTFTIHPVQDLQHNKRQHPILRAPRG
jgi:hypothetical protein